MDVKKKDDIGKKHISVLLHELVDGIKIFKNKKNIIVDCTLGMGGHAIEIIKKMNPGDIFIGFDADIKNLTLAQERIKPVSSEQKVETIFIHSNFLHLKKELEEKDIKSITGIYYDLGLSSLHVDEADRGFSFQLDGPLDMRFDKRNGDPASLIVNRYSKEQLIGIFKEYGEEPMSKKIAEFIFERRRKQKFETTKDLADVISEASKNPKSKNRIFQALRIETNKELENAKISISDAIQLLSSEGHIFIISFHSLEDRLVKQLFKQESRNCICKSMICDCNHTKNIILGNKKPILPSNDEMKINPRSKSAKGRFAIKI